MGCVSSTLLTHDADDFTQIGGSSAFGHHIVSLTSTTYGLLTLDPPSAADHDRSSPPPPPPATTTLPPTPPPRFTLGSLFPTPLVPSDPRPFKPEVINSWELMAGLDSTPLAVADHSFRFSPFPPPKPRKENSNPNLPSHNFHSLTKPSDDVFLAPKNSSLSSFLDRFEMLCPPNGQDRVVLYTTTLRGIMKTFQACNAVRSAIEALGILFCERDISMDSGFREELRELMKGRDNSELVPPRLFVKGRYIGGVDDIMRVVEEGGLPDLVQGLPKVRTGYICEGCGGMRFLPCFRCNGSCKMVMEVGEEQEMGQKQARTVVVRCSDCNENGLVLCPICS